MNCQILLKEVVTETLRGYVTGGYLCTFNYILMENRKALPNEASNLVEFLLKWIIITRPKKQQSKMGFLWIVMLHTCVCVCMSVQSCQYLSVIQNNLFLIAHTWYECRNRHNGTWSFFETTLQLMIRSTCKLDVQRKYYSVCFTLRAS